MVFFNLLTLIALAVWTPTPWWILVIMTFFWTIIDLQLTPIPWDRLKPWRKQRNLKKINKNIRKWGEKK